MKYIPKESNVVAQPQWRWNRILELVGQQPSVLRTSDDQEVRVGLKFWRDMKPAEDDEDKERLIYARHPNLYNAYALYSKSDTYRYGIEALIVCNTPLEHIAAVLSLPVRVVYWYEKLWYDLREKCKNIGFVAMAVIPEINYNNMSAHNPDVLWKVAAAYLGAQVAVDFIGKCLQTPETNEKLLDVIRQQMTKNLALSAMGGMRITSENLAAAAEIAGVVSKDGPSPKGAVSEEVGYELMSLLQRKVIQQGELDGLPDDRQQNPRRRIEAVITSKEPKK
jgi:hypothetical protein